MNVKLNFIFSGFKILIDHTDISDIGEFTLFCLRAVAEEATLQEIAEATLLDVGLIESHLKYVKEKGYLSKEHSLTDKGRKLVQILEFKENCSDKFVCYFDNYIEDAKLKSIFHPDVIEKSQSTEAPLINPKIKLTWLYRIVNELAKTKLIDYLKEIIPNYRQLIDEEIAKLTLSVKFYETKTVTVSLSVDELLKYLSYDALHGIEIAIPVAVCESKLSLAIDDKDLNAMLQQWIKQNEFWLNKQIYNLLDGSKMDTTLSTQNKKDVNTAYFDKLINLSQIQIPNIDVATPSKLFSFLNINRTINEKYATAVIDDGSLASIFQSKLACR